MPRTPKISSKGSTDHDDTGTNSSDSDMNTATATPHMTIPQWLIPEKQTPKFFSVQLPAIPPETAQAIRASLQNNNGDAGFMTQESTRMIHAISQLQHEEKQAQHKVKVHKDKLAQALANKTEELETLQQSSHDDTQKALDSLEKTLRKHQDKEYQKVRDAIQAQVKSELEQKFAAEREKKRKREEQEDGEVVDEQEEGEEVEDDVPAKRQKLELSGGGKDVSATKPKTLVEELEDKRGDIQQKMEALSGKKAEMFWLLKQVIMQETKQKMERAKQQKLEAAKVAGDLYDDLK